MKEDDQTEKPSGSSYFRYRSPVFSKEEVQALLDLVKKYKSIVFNKSNSSATVSAKESAWLKIEKLFNRQGFTHTRSAECLKTKFENLKKRARTTSKNVLDENNESTDDITNQLVALMCDAENNTNVCDEPLESDGDLNDDEPNNETSDNDNRNKVFHGGVGGSDTSRLMNRSLNFSPEECSVLLQCVRQEKKVILSKAISAAAINRKSKAWSRITRRYNHISPQKRSTKVLRTKFDNMKRLAKNMSLKDYIKDFGKKHERLQEAKEPARNIKKEPFDQDEGRNSLDEDDMDDANDSSNNHNSSNSDPLHRVLNSDFGAFNQSECKEIVKLKTMLLNYEMQTAKLQRKRLEDLMAAEAQERETKAVETALRLRAARLETIAAEMKLPVTHPALAYAEEETRAQHYITQQRYHPN